MKGTAIVTNVDLKIKILASIHGPRGHVTLSAYKNTTDRLITVGMKTRGRDGIESYQYIDLDADEFYRAVVLSRDAIDTIS